MERNTTQEEFEKYIAGELWKLTPLLEGIGYTLDSYQPHLGGERFLMQAVTTTSGRKMILLGTHSNGARVVIKASREVGGKQEIIHERNCRQLLQKIRFAYEVFFAPEELFFEEIDGYVIGIYAFLPQERSFLERPLEEQFTFALRAFKAQESAHVTTYGHRKAIRRVFQSFDARNYLETFRTFMDRVADRAPSEISLLLTEGEALLSNNSRTIDQYGEFLTHTDFVPHNFRIVGTTMYLLDHSSLRFGNKYEGWARFINFMTLYNPALADALIQYVKDNRTPEESVALRLMRIYRLGEIIWYYTNATEKSSDNLRTLNSARVHFWADVLRATLADTPLTEEIRTNYIKLRDSLRSDDEKKRQIGLH